MLHGVRQKVDKELKWSQVPENEIPLYKQAEGKQWGEHLTYEAIRIVDPQEAQDIRRRLPKERIFKARFAYTDKNCSKRREDPTCPPNP